MLRPLSRRLIHSCSNTSSPHPALTYLPGFLSPAQQSLLLVHSLRLLAAPTNAHMTSAARKVAREYRLKHGQEEGFMGDEGYVFEEGHFDGVIRSYRERVVRHGGWLSPASTSSPSELDVVLNKIYSLLPPEHEREEGGIASNPPDHIQLHLLHLSSTGAIFPHVDNVAASGGTIIGISLGGERIMKFKKKAGVDPGLVDEFQVLLEAGSAYIQREPLRSLYTHEIPAKATLIGGAEIGGTQRLSLMLRDNPPPVEKAT